MAEISKYIVYGGVILVALILGRWYATERDKLMVRGEPWVNSFVTKPGIIIMIILGTMILYKIKNG